ncbi:hypothetical protein H4217_008151 [Coemansia sp. RSA 1939]|nr:hypothetical protein H4217_008151 [Coemansia sp. RSA 1939]
MFASTVPDYILSSGVVAQRSRTNGGRGRLSTVSEDSMSSSAAEYIHDFEDSATEIKAVLGYLPAPQRGWSQQSLNSDTPRLVYF